MCFLHYYGKSIFIKRKYHIICKNIPANRFFTSLFILSNILPKFANTLYNLSFTYTKSNGGFNKCDTWNKYVTKSNVKSNLIKKCLLNDGVINWWLIKSQNNKNRMKVRENYIHWEKCFNITTYTTKSFKQMVTRWILTNDELFPKYTGS